ncbi:cation:proton antiporter [Dactylosporangium vinaceum]|uniref:Cation:proton antiporter n=1 Tax=Dactylosporangium vinaceum TaxID=53362 RepID=A0ABV5MQT7_9ACTN|nr:cation:proton antiporter [Dactylosporangium vinaceum]UAB93870.1 cation:proton antiporter [Dactylosporangium vinaceum]
MTLAIAPALSQHQVLIFLLQLGTLLLVALCLGRLARRFGLPAVVGELTTGILLGPSVFGSASPGIAGWLLPADADQAHLLDAVGQLAVLLLVGIAGAHLDLKLIRRRQRVVTRVGAGGLLVPLALGIGAGWLLPGQLLGAKADRLTFALFLGVALCVSAIPVIAKTLSDMRLLHRDLGQLTLAVAAIDDVVGWFLLSLVSTMVLTGIGPGGIALSAALLIGFVVLAVVAGRPAVHLALRIAGRSEDPGPAAATAVVLIVLGAAAGQALGLEAVFGAFVVGLLISGARPADRARLAPLRTISISVLAPIFLAGAGLRIDLGALRDPGVLLAGVVMLLLATLGKFAGAYLGARLSRLNRWEGLALGAGLNARGVIEVVVATVGLRLGVLSTASYTIVVLIAVLTSVMAPPMLRWAMTRIEQSADERLRLAAWEAPALDVADGR